MNKQGFLFATFFVAIFTIFSSCSAIEGAEKNLKHGRILCDGTSKKTYERIGISIDKDVHGNCWFAVWHKNDVAFGAKISCYTLSIGAAALLSYFVISRLTSIA